MVKDLLKTHEVAALFNLPVHAIYNWLRHNKIPEPDRDPVNGYRLWTQEHIQAIRDYLTDRKLRRVS
jgi:DNA-binding transcriptional MerR regulator